MHTRARAIMTLALGAVLIAAVDQGIKGLVRTMMAPDESHSVIPGLFSLTYRLNRGVAFSLLDNMPMALLVAMNVLVLVVFLLLIWSYLGTRTGRAAAVLVVGGALGNLIDRVRLRYVVDYLDFHVWPVFNLADTCVVVGVLLLVLLMVRAEHAAAREPARAATPEPGGTSE